MPDFSRPEYASYVQLCRELRLERVFEDGDQFWWPGDRAYYSAVSAQDGSQRSLHFAHDNEGVYLYSGCAQGEGRQPDLDRVTAVDHAVWLPALADWLERLEEAGIGVIEIERREDRYEAIGGHRAWDCEWSCSAAAHVEAPTREEAAARLWMTVRG